MTDFQNVAVKIKNYKCFGEEPQGFDYIKPINVLIGKNNCGKSSLLEVIDYVIHPKNLDDRGHKGQVPTFMITFRLQEGDLRTVFRADISGGEIDGNHWDFGRQWIDKEIEISLKPNTREFIKTNPPLPTETVKQYFEEVARRTPLPFVNMRFKLLRAERNIKPEQDNRNNVDEHGVGATNFIQRFINYRSLSRDLVEKQLLEELNKIMEPDSIFNRILVEKDDKNNIWEILLEEENKGVIPLSHSGDGLKTVLLVLIYILLVPEKEGTPLNKYVYAFEELENSLHPALQRRLFGYLRNVAVNNNSTFFITTHSNVVIDLFSKDENAQIYHIQHDGSDAHIRPVKTYIEKSGILDDLDVRASDLLQSNGVIWVEGPSDRIYINRWIELWSEDKFREGEHYQCIFYGGRLLSHLTAEPIDEEERKELINILLTNRNAIIIMDSDKKNKEEDINETKKRIEKEVNDVGGYCWITEGKEIENYIPKLTLSSFYDKEISDDIDKYVPLWDYLDTIKEGEGKRYLSKKPLFAENIRPFFTKEDLSGHLDLNTQLEQVVSKIKQWNPETALQNDNKKPKQPGEEEL